MSGLDLEGMDEIVQEFLVESQENLDQLDLDLIALEQAPTSRELLSSIFRTIHTIKGTSGFLAFSNLEAVTHVGESLLSRLRDGVLEVDPTTTDALLSMVDVVRQLLAAIELDGTEGDVGISRAVVLVEACLAPPATDIAAPAAATSAIPTPAPARVPRQPTAGDVGGGSTGIPVEEPGPSEPVPLPQLRAEEQSSVRRLIGEILVSSGSATPGAIAAAVQRQIDGDSRRIGEILVSAGDVDERAVEDGLETQRKRSVAESSLRVDVELLDRLMRQVGELVLVRNQLLRSTGHERDSDLSAMVQRLSLITGELQEGVMRTRMQPIDHLLAKLPRVVRDLSAQCGKQVALVVAGKETELDKTLLEAIKDPLTHIVRNSIDHGIETPETRRAVGKAELGTLRIAAFHESGRIVIEIADDGAGIDPATIGAKAVERGMISLNELSTMTTQDILKLIFRPGFSTAEKVTNVSGRGVGMDVVRTNVERIGGTVDVDSVPGEGTRFRLTIPLTLAIIPALTIACRDQQFAIPQVSVLELVSISADRRDTEIERIAGAPVYRLRGSLLPLVELADALGIEGHAPTGPTTVAVLQAEDRRFGLIVDAVLSSEEIVVKALAPRLKAIGCYSGATILGDGRVALILDVADLASGVMRAPLAVSRGLGLGERGLLGGTPERVLVASIGAGRRVAIPLDSVTRLEEIELSMIERVGDRDVVDYHGEIVPLVRLAQHLGVSGVTQPDGADSGVLLRQPVVVAVRAGRTAALLVERILDIVDGDVKSHSALGAVGLLGSAIVGGKVTEMLDVRQAILAADPDFFAMPGGWLDEPDSAEPVQEVAP